MYFTEIINRLVVQLGAVFRSVASKRKLTFSQTLTLLSIPFDGIAISSLANLLGLDTSTLSRNIDKLNTMGLVHRKTSLNDSRIILIVLSSSGKKVVDNLELDLEHKNFNILKNITLEDQQILLDLLGKLSWALECDQNK